MDLEKLRELFGGIARRTVSRAQTNAPAAFESYQQPAPMRSTTPTPVSGGGGGMWSQTPEEARREANRTFALEEHAKRSAGDEALQRIGNRFWAKDNDEPGTSVIDPLGTKEDALSAQLKDLNAQITERGGSPARRVRIAGAPPEWPERTPGPEFDASTLEYMRSVRQSGARELTQEEFDGLSDRQKAAVRFNTALLDASLADDQAGNTQSTEDFVGLLGLQDTSGDALDEFLQLDRLIGESIIMKLDDAQSRQDSASSLRWARGDEQSVPEAQRLSDALSSASLLQGARQKALASTGRGVRSEEPPLLGFGSTPADQVVQYIYTGMVDSALADSPTEDILTGLATANKQAGTNVTPQQVWDYLGAQIQAAELGDGKLQGPDLSAVTNQPFNPLTTAELRKRFGFEE